ncbi:MAG: hypothetical protein H6721_07975 [Sandaracinus sp.]|nr:hypothetical protein [Sandaracinus sp.]MCB9632056.1 hypothetical protein [Sandaracinus sp.]
MRVRKTAVLGSLMLLACSSEEGAGSSDWALTAEDSADAADASSVEAALSASLVSGATGAATGPEAASAAAEAVSSLFVPEGCLTTETTLRSTTYTFDACRGPRGLQTIDGTVVVEYTVARDGTLSATLRSTDLQAGAVALRLDVVATYTAGPPERLELVVESGATGSGGRGLSRSGSSTVTWEPSCVVVDASTEVTFGSRSGTTTLESLRRCDGACPSGRATYTSDAGMLLLTFDGTSTARWSATGAARATSGEVALDCE